MKGTSFRLLVKNVAQLVQVTGNNEKFLSGKSMDKLSIIENGSMIVDNNGMIADIGTTDYILNKYSSNQFDSIIDCQNKQCIVPGLCDAHTHSVWSGDRVNEFAMKLKGATYMDIHKMGGGIGYTVKCVRQSSENELLSLFLSRLDRMMANGTTLLEAKSGYGLNLQSELKMLRVIEQGNRQHPMTIISNYCGAHSVNKSETNVKDYTKDIIENQIPTIIKEKNLGNINPTMIDVFHEKGIFEYSDTKSILECGIKNGLLVNFHGDELNYNKSGELAYEIGATSVSHLECVSIDGMKLMSKKNIVCVLLPTTAYVLQIEKPPARDMIDKYNNIVALGSDFNPNAHCLSMPFTMNLACVTMRLSLNEALAAATINSAAALAQSDKYGSLEIGKHGDFIIIDNEKWEHLIYELVDPPIDKVFKNGNVVFEKTKNVIKKGLLKSNL